MICGGGSWGGLAGASAWANDPMAGNNEQNRVNTGSFFIRRLERFGSYIIVACKRLDVKTGPRIQFSRTKTLFQAKRVGSSLTMEAKGFVPARLPMEVV